MLLNKNSLKKYYVLLMLLPRVAVAYPIYASIIPFVSNWKNLKHIRNLILLLIFPLITYAINFGSYRVSLTGFLLELVLLFSLLMFAAGFEVSIKGCQTLIRRISLFALIFSVLNMMQYGFPLRLPYIHYLPDAFGAFYGLGGAKIVTIIGYIALLTELRSIQKSKHYIAIAVLNLIIPSYILGMLCAGISMMYLMRKSVKVVAAIALAAVIITPYILTRYEALGSSDRLHNPKIEAAISVAELYDNYPSTLVTGAGLGQFVSTSAIWSSNVMAQFGSHDIPNLPQFYSSEFHIVIFNKIYNQYNDFWDVSSSYSKPYNTLSSLFGEFGVFYSLVLLYLIFRRAYHSSQDKNYSITLMLFLSSLFTLDLWHDNPFLIILLFLYSSRNQ